MSDQQKLRENIPLYLAGELNKEEKSELEEALKTSATLQQELEDVKEIRGFYADISEEIPAPDPMLFNKILQSIEKEERMEVRKAPAFSLKPLLDFMESLFKMPSLSWGVAGVQLAIILLLVSGAPQTEQKYETLSSTPAVLDGGIRFTVVFQETALEGEIRELLLELGGRFVSGPSTVGSYVLVIKADDGSKEEVLTKLQESSSIVFAEISI